MHGKRGSGEKGSHSSGKKGRHSYEYEGQEDGDCQCVCRRHKCKCWCTGAESCGDGEGGEKGEGGKKGKGGKKGRASSDQASSEAPPPTRPPTPAFILPPSVFATVSPTPSPSKGLLSTVSCDGFDAEESIGVQVPYRYEITLDENLISIDEARELIEKALLDAVAEELVVCDDNSGERRGLSSGDGSVAVSALPEDTPDESCKDSICTEGGMTIYVPKGEASSNSTKESQCRAQAIIVETMADLLAENLGIKSISMTQNDELQCDDNDESKVPPPVAVVSMQSSESSFPVAAVTAGLVGAALLAFLALFLVRRRKSTDRGDVVHIWTPDPDGGADEAYKCGYKDGYAYRFDEFQAGRENKEVAATVYAEKPTRTELEGNAFVLGFNVQDSVDAYCKGFQDGYDAASADLIHSTCDVHKCNSARCELCRRSTKPQFLQVEKDHEFSIPDDVTL